MVFEALTQGFNAPSDGQRLNSRQAAAQEHLIRDSQSHQPRSNWHPGHNKEWTAAMQATLHKDLKINKDGTYTVQYPDCLRSIAARELHMMGKKATRHAIDAETDRLVELNKDRYPSLAKNRDLILGGSQQDGRRSEGWSLRLSLGEHGKRERTPQSPPASGNDRGYYESPAGGEPPPPMAYRGRPMPKQPVPYNGEYQDFRQQQNFAPGAGIGPQYGGEYYRGRPHSTGIDQGLSSFFGGLVGGGLAGGFMGRGMFGQGMHGQRDYWHRGFGRPGYDDYAGAQRWQRGYDDNRFYQPNQYNDYSMYGSNSLPLITQSQGWGGDYRYGRGYPNNNNNYLQYGMQAPYRRHQQNRGIAGIGRMLGLF